MEQLDLRLSLVEFDQEGFPFSGNPAPFARDTPSYYALSYSKPTRKDLVIPVRSTFSIGPKTCWFSAGNGLE